MAGHGTSKTYFLSLSRVPVSQGAQLPFGLCGRRQEAVEQELKSWAVPSVAPWALGSLLVIAAVGAGCAQNSTDRSRDGVNAEHETMAQDDRPAVLDLSAGHGLDCLDDHRAADGEFLPYDQREGTDSPGWPCEPGMACTDVAPCLNGCTCMADDRGHYCTWDCVSPDNCPDGWDCVPKYVEYAAEWLGFCIRPPEVP